MTIDDIRRDLRITTTAYDDQITNAIAFAKEDMKRVGIVSIDQTDPLIGMCIELYCKATFDTGGKGDMYMSQYNALRDATSLYSKFNGGTTT